MSRRILLAAALILAPQFAFAQAVQEAAPITVRQVPYWVTNGVIGDGGNAADSPISSFGVTNATTNGICVSSGRATAAGRQQLCLGAPLNAAAQITLQNYGTATPQNLQFVINGTSYPFPGSLANITIGTTPVVGGTNSLCLFVSGGVVGQQTCTLSAITSLTGDITATGPGITATTLATVNANVGTFGSGGVVPIITVNGKGLITAVSTTPAGITVGSTVVTSGTTNGLLYANGSVLGNLATLASGVLVTSAGGVPSISATLPSGLIVPTPTFTGTLTLPDSATWASTGISKVAALSVGSATLPSGGNISISGQYQINGTQIAASNLSNGATGSGAVVLAAAPAVSGTWTGSPTFSGNITFSGQSIHTGTSSPTSAGGNTVVMGTVTSPTLSNTGQAFLYNTVVNGEILQGDGSTNDVSVFNKSGTLVFGVPTGTTKLNFPSLVSGTCSSGLGLDSGNNTVLISCPGAAGSIQVGSTTVTSGTNNYVLTTGTGTLANVTIASLLTAGSGITLTGTTNATLAITAGQVPGTATNDSASAGNVGQVIESNIASGSAVGISSNTATTITQITLTAGDWDIECIAYYTGGSTTASIYRSVSISTTTNSLNLTVPLYNIVPDYGQTAYSSTTGNASGLGVLVPPYRVSISSNTTYYMVAQATFTVSTTSVYGYIRGRRVR